LLLLFQFLIRPELKVKTREEFGKRPNILVDKGIKIKTELPEDL
jgi:hypothetical protein